jgi:hypothetical protein
MSAVSNKCSLIQLLYSVHSLASHSDAPIEESITSGAVSAIPMQRRNSRKGEQS